MQGLCGTAEASAHNKSEIDTFTKLHWQDILGTCRLMIHLILVTDVTSKGATMEEAGQTKNDAFEHYRQ